MPSAALQSSCKLCDGSVNLGGWRLHHALKHCAYQRTIISGSLSKQFDQTDDRYHPCDEAYEPNEGGNERDVKVSVYEPDPAEEHDHGYAEHTDAD